MRSLALILFLAACGGGPRAGDRCDTDRAQLGCESSTTGLFCDRDTVVTVTCPSGCTTDPLACDLFGSFLQSCPRAITGRAYCLQFNLLTYCSPTGTWLLMDCPAADCASTSDYPGAACTP